MPGTGRLGNQGVDDLNNAPGVALDVGHVKARIGNGLRGAAVEVATAILPQTGGLQCMRLSKFEF